MRRFDQFDFEIGTKFILLEDNIVYTIKEIDNGSCYACWEYISSSKKYKLYNMYSLQLLLSIGYIIEFE